MLHHLVKPWQMDEGESTFYFCADPGCDVVYFEDGGRVFRVSDLRTRVGLKEPGEDATLCYCFGVTVGAAATDSGIRAFVVDQTRDKSCSCEVTNPSGMCCLKHFPRRANVG
jgi:hypothetical protein